MENLIDCSLVLAMYTIYFCSRFIHKDEYHQDINYKQTRTKQKYKKTGALICQFSSQMLDK